MQFGAIVLVRLPDSDLYSPLAEELAGAIVEIRVEQHLDRQTTFAIRFQEDFGEDCEGAVDHPHLKLDNGIAILVPKGPDSDELVCLVQGQIEQSNVDIVLGGVGSAMEIRGQDIRTRVDRECTSLVIPGSKDVEPPVEPPDVIEILVSELETDIDEEIEYTHYLTPLTFVDGFNHVGTILDALTRVAKDANYSFWLEYEATQQGKQWKVKPRVHIEPSPARKTEGPATDTLPLDQLVVVPEDAVYLRPLPVGEQCETVVNFKIDTDLETVGRASAAGLKNDGEEQTHTQEESADDPAVKGGSADKGKASLCITKPGEPENAAKVAEVAVTEGAWRIKATTLTSAHMLGQVLQPHDLVWVTGAGCKVNSAYQVSDVTHVINPAEHWMDVSLRTNALPKGATNAL